MKDILNLFGLVFENVNKIKFFSIGLFDLVLLCFVFATITIFVFSFLKKS